MNRLQQRLTDAIVGALQTAGLTRDGAPAWLRSPRAQGAYEFAEALACTLSGFAVEECLSEKQADAGLLKASGYNAGVYREAIALAINHAQRATGVIADPEPKTTDYCGSCGESPESGSHLPHGHAYVPKRSDQVMSDVSSSMAPPVLVDMTKPAEMLKASARDYRITDRPAAEVARDEATLKRAALVFAADELEQLHERRPELPVLVAIRNLYRLALGLTS